MCCSILITMEVHSATSVLIGSVSRQDEVYLPSLLLYGLVLYGRESGWCGSCYWYEIALVDICCMEFRHILSTRPHLEILDALLESRNWLNCCW